MAATGPKPFHYSLRTLFCVVTAGAVLSACLRGDGSMVLGIGAFCYGGIIAIPCYAFVASLVVLSTQTTWGERAGDVFAGIVGATAWIVFIVCALGKWPQLCVAYSLCAIAVMGFVVWRGWQGDPGPSPEATLARLKQTKLAGADRLRREWGRDRTDE